MEDELSQFIIRADKQFERADKQFERADKQFEGLAAFVTRADNNLEMLTEQVANLQGSVQNLDLKIDEVSASLRTEISKLAKAITHGSAKASRLLDVFAGDQLTLREEVAQLRRRIEALEKRNPAA